MVGTRSSSPRPINTHRSRMEPDTSTPVSGTSPRPVTEPESTKPLAAPVGESKGRAQLAKTVGDVAGYTSSKEPTAAQLAAAAQLAQRPHAPVPVLALGAVTPPELEPYYQPVAAWTGRMILPVQDRPLDDAVLFEVRSAPPDQQHLIGKTVKLKWSDDPAVQAYVRSVTTDVSFTQGALKSIADGNLHPVRLDGEEHVGPLQSLAGARMQDDVTVKLPDVSAVKAGDGQTPTLEIGKEPVQVSGDSRALVKMIGQAAPDDDRVIVQHFNKETQRFDGPTEVIRFPEAPPDSSGIARSTATNLHKSPANDVGWYLYGARDAEGTLVAQALEPRAAVQLEPQRVVTGQKESLEFFQKEVWADTESQKGKVSTTVIAPNAATPEEALAGFVEGEQYIGMHLFGGIGGEKKDERGPLGLITGHFAFGTATIDPEPLSGGTVVGLTYEQIYAHNSDGIVSGSVERSDYMGNLQRGWLGSRPVSDVVIKFDPVTQDYDFGGVKLSPMRAFQEELQKMAARYRTGNGTGGASVTPSNSCVQDSSQALYIAVQQIKRQVESTPEIQAWLEANPNHPEAQRFQELVDFGHELERNLVPLGLVRRDWRHNADESSAFAKPQSTLRALIRAVGSWRNVLPRRAHDEIGSLLLKHGASMYVMRTNQVGGEDPGIVPLAPTKLL